MSSLNARVEKDKQYVDDLVTYQTNVFSALSNFVALKGGALKKEQYLSGDMADILSNLYMGYSLIWEKENNGMDEEIFNYIIRRLYNENCTLINKVIDNMSMWILYPLKTRKVKMGYKDDEELIDHIFENSDVKSNLLNKILENATESEPFIKNLLKMEEMNVNSEEYKKLYDEVVSVGEFNI